MDAVMMRCGLAGMVMTPFRPSTWRGHPMFAGSTMPGTPSNDGPGVVGGGATVIVGCGAGAVAGAVEVSPDSQAGRAAARSRMNGMMRYSERADEHRDSFQ